MLHDGWYRCHLLSQGKCARIQDLHTCIMSFDIDENGATTLHNDITLDFTCIPLVRTRDAYNIEILVTCNGLIILRDISSTKVLVCNPISMQCTGLPPLPTGCKLVVGMFSWALDYREASNEYKVVVLLGYQEDGGQYTQVVGVITIGSAASPTWRAIPLQNRNVSLFSRGVVAGGKLNWIATSLTKIKEESQYMRQPYRYVLVSMDLAKDVLMEISDLSFGTSWTRRLIKGSLFVNGGCLSCCPETQSSSTLEIWSMRDWDAMNQREKEHVIALDSGVQQIWGYTIYSAPNDDKLFIDIYIQRTFYPTRHKTCWLHSTWAVENSSHYVLLIKMVFHQS